jgi:hypothetical protein
MKRFTWMLIASSLVMVVGVAVAVGRTPAKRVILYSQLRQHGLPHLVSRLLATYWPERLLSWTLKAARRYDRRAEQVKEQATKIMHLPHRPHMSMRRSA